MAAPAYVTDLTDLLVDMPTTTGWSAIGTPAALTAPETDVFIQGSNCISKGAWSSATKGMIYNQGAGVTVASGNAVFMWLYFMCPNSLAVETSGGMRVIIGSSASAYKHWYVRGSDGYVLGGWTNAAVDPTVTPDTTTGAPSTTLQYFGGLANVPSSGPSKGSPFCIDAYRHGRCLHVTGGDSGSGYGTFIGLSAYNDNSSNRFGQFQTIDAGYLFKGCILFGLPSKASTLRQRSTNVAYITTSTPHGLKTGDMITVSGLGGTGYNLGPVAVSSTPSTTQFTYASTGTNEGSTADTGGLIEAIVDFRDSNRNIVIQNTKKVATAFNGFEVNNANSRVDWTNVQVTALGTVSPGYFKVNQDAVVNLSSCFFTGLGAFDFLSQTTADSTVWRQCGLVTQGGGTFTDCRFNASSSSSSLLCDDPGLVSGCTFISDGSNHALEFTTACAGNTYTFDGHIFSGYATSDGTSGNEVIYNKSGGHVILNVTNCTGTISVRNDGSSTTELVTTAITLKVIVTDQENNFIEAAFAYIDDDDQTPYVMNTTTDENGEASVIYTGDPMTGSRWRVRKYGYKPFQQLVDTAGDDITLPVTLIVDPQQT